MPENSNKIHNDYKDTIIQLLIPSPTIKLELSHPISNPEIENLLNIILIESP